MPLTEYEAEMVRRAAKACRNAYTQMEGNRDWFLWVADYLKNLADGGFGETSGPEFDAAMAAKPKGEG